MKLENKCEICNGTGKVYEYYSHEYGTTDKCYRCGETGIVPSEFGEELIEFFEKYILPKINMDLKWKN